MFTFSELVEIPGQVLEPGTYVFKLADSAADRNIVDVFNKMENQLYGVFLRIPDSRLNPSPRPIITFDKVPPPLRKPCAPGFIPGENCGHDFVCPKKKAVALAKANNPPVPLMPD